MRLLKPYHRQQDLIRLLDNGGKFWHLLCRKGDGSVQRGELEAASGSSTERVGAFIYLAMKMAEMLESEQAGVLERLSPILMQEYVQLIPKQLFPSEIEEIGSNGQSVMVAGFVRQSKQMGEVIGDCFWYRNSTSETRAKQFPLHMVYDVFVLTNSKQQRTQSAVVATRKGLELDPSVNYRFAGVLRPLHNNVDGVRTHQFVLRPLYYSIVGDAAPQGVNPRRYK